MSRWSPSVVTWHRIPTGEWQAWRAGIFIGAAVMTGRHGVDNYPWDWWLDRGPSGVSESLRAAKRDILDRLPSLGGPLA